MGLRVRADLLGAFADPLLASRFNLSEEQLFLTLLRIRTSMIETSPYTATNMPNIQRPRN